MSRFVDANIFLRFLLNDHPTRSPACRQLFLAAEQGREHLWTSEIIVSEVVYVLARLYKISRQDIAARLLPLLQLKQLRVPNKRMYRSVFDLFTTTNLSYADCHTAALIELRGESELYSFDEGFRKIPTLSRLEP